ncbi:MAG: hypothetical protein J6V09_03240 [Clostridia bacterium]|nr:hypothetical protein [Clostridia bacterium]
MKKKTKYKSDMPRLLYSFFISHSEGGAPSFQKFARSIGITLAELEGYRTRKEFDRAWRECNEIRRDYLIDAALTRRHDPSFVKFLLSSEYGMGEKDKEPTDTALTVSLDVLTDGKHEA